MKKKRSNFYLFLLFIIMRVINKSRNNMEEEIYDI